MKNIKRELLNLNERELREALELLLQKRPEDAVILDRFKVVEDDPAKSLKQWMSEQSDKYNIFPDHLLSTLMKRIEFINHTIHEWIIREPKAAIELFFEYVEILDKYTIHTNYITYQIIDQIIDTLDYLVDELPSLNDQIFLWCTEYLKGNPDRFCTVLVEVVYLDSFQDSAYASKKKAIADLYLDRFSKMSAEEVRVRLEQVVSWLTLRMKFTNRKEEMYQLLEKLVHLKFARIQLVQILWSDGQKKKAIDLLIEGKKKASYLEDAIEYSYKLLEFYMMDHRISEVKAELQWQIVFCNIDDAKQSLDYLKQVTYKGEWSQMVNRLIDERIVNQLEVLPLLSHTKQIKRLLEFISADPDLIDILAYEDQLKAHDPHKTRELFLQCIDSELQLLSKRSEYQEFAQMMLKLKNYPKGMQRLSEYISKWRIDYKNRKAFWDELSKAGVI